VYVELWEIRKMADSGITYVIPVGLIIGIITWIIRLLSKKISKKNIPDQFIVDSIEDTTPYEEKLALFINIVETTYFYQLQDRIGDDSIKNIVTNLYPQLLGGVKRDEVIKTTELIILFNKLEK